MPPSKETAMTRDELWQCDKGQLVRLVMEYQNDLATHRDRWKVMIGSLLLNIALTGIIAGVLLQ